MRSSSQLKLLDRGLEMEHAGGFYTAYRPEYLQCERLRKKRLLKFWNGRRSRFWSAQFYTITEKGRISRNRDRAP